MAKYLALFGFSSEAIKQFVVSPSDRAAAVRRLVESVGGSLECYYWMFGQYDGVAIVEMPDSRTQAAVTLAIISSDAFTHFETHELIEVDDLTGIAMRARNIAYQPPGAERPHRPGDSAYGINPPHGRTMLTGPTPMGRGEAADQRPKWRRRKHSKQRSEPCVTPLASAPRCTAAGDRF